jgi:hypothetical protein
MSIPRSVSIGGIRFTIKLKKLSDDEFGRVIFDTREIQVNKNLKDEPLAIYETIRHEMIHAALDVSGLGFARRFDEEAVVRAIETIFFPAWERIQPKIQP